MKFNHRRFDMHELCDVGILYQPSASNDVMGILAIRFMAMVLRPANTEVIVLMAEAITKDLRSVHVDGNRWRFYSVINKQTRCCPDQLARDTSRQATVYIQYKQSRSVNLQSSLHEGIPKPRAARITMQ